MQNIKQSIVFAAIVVAVLMGVFPPWEHIDDQKVGHPMGYAPIWQPPVQRERDSISVLGFKMQLDIKTQSANSIDFKRLLMQLAVLSLITAGAVALLKKS